MFKKKALPPPPPDTVDYRSFWLINILLATIKRGSFLTTNIWIPKEAWYQSETVVPIQIDKIACIMYTGGIFDKIGKFNASSLSSSVRIFFLHF